MSPTSFPSFFRSAALTESISSPDPFGIKPTFSTTTSSTFTSTRTDSDEAGEVFRQYFYDVEIYTSPAPQLDDPFEGRSGAARSVALPQPVGTRQAQGPEAKHLSQCAASGPNLCRGLSATRRCFDTAIE